MSYGFLVGNQVSNLVGTSLLRIANHPKNTSATYNYSSEMLNEFAAFQYVILPSESFTPTFVMAYPTVSVSKSGTALSVACSGGNINTSIMVFGR
jgi:hypothetical protein